MEIEQERYLMAHRGYAAAFPENTMLSFQEAAKVGVDAMELDVHLSKDGEIVIIHDETLERTTDGKGEVHEFTLEELKTFNAAAKFTGTLPPGVEGCEIPSLREYLTWAKGQSFFTNIEFKNNKTYYVGLEKKVIALLKEMEMLDRVIFSSFNHPSLMHAKEMAPGVKMGALTKKPVNNPGSYVKMCGLQFLHPEWDQITSKMVKNCHKHGVRVHVWTPNTKEEMKQCLKLEVDGLIVDDVKLGREVLEEGI